jgi:hypothetical protein
MLLQRERRQREAKARECGGGAVDVGQEMRDVVQGKRAGLRSLVLPGEIVRRHTPIITSFGGAGATASPR